jgi:hypothetical protein
MGPGFLFTFARTAVDHLLYKYYMPVFPAHLFIAKGKFPACASTTTDLEGRGDMR